MRWLGHALGVTLTRIPLFRYSAFHTILASLPDIATLFFLFLLPVLSPAPLFLPSLRLEPAGHLAYFRDAPMVVFCWRWPYRHMGLSYEALPQGLHAVSADGLSIEPEGIEAATWSLIYLRAR